MTSLNFGPVVLGGNVFGWTADKDASFAILDAFVEGGGTSIDTADSYSEWVPGNTGGDSERILGEWMTTRGNRDNLVLATKVGAKSDRKNLSASTIALAIDESLQRLQTDRVDVYYAHFDDEATPQEETLGAFDALVKAGKVRELGVSNLSAERIRSAAAIAAAEGLTPFTVAQNQWNLVERAFDTELLPLISELGLTELPYFSLARGFLTGKYRPGSAVDSPRAGQTKSYLDDPRNVSLLAALDEIAAAHSASLTAVSLAWLRAQPVVAAPIASASRLDQVAPLLEVVDLSADEVARLSAITA